MVSSASKGAAWGSAFGLVVAAMLAVLFGLGPLVERSIFPVVDNLQARIISQDDNTYRIVVVGRKVRQCTFDSVSAEVGKGGEWNTVSAFFIDPKDPSRTHQEIPIKQSGTQFFSEMFIYPVGDKVRMHFNYRCHPFWITSTELFTTLTPESSKK